ncbi:MAG: efflux transporter periplasmic adaptor subunit [Herminiimonas sp.]|nr:efflux transporter periplasmic adaptor subunit [Herminiimonas sp.]
MRLIRPIISLATGALILSSLAGCGDKPVQAQAPGGGAPPPPEVSVVSVAPERIGVVTELPGRLEATRIAQVRARVPGIVLKRTFREGSDVKAGDVLYLIDPASFKANLSSADAGVARAEANLAAANLKVQRYRPLVETNAISKQEFDDALTAQKQALADVATGKAARETARLNLGYATVNAPISGRIGRALVTEGALVGQGEATPLAVIQQLDPIYATLSQSSTDLLQLKRSLANGTLQSAGKDQAKVQLVTEDGNVSPDAGKLLFSDVTVDESSGSVSIRAEFPNPQRNLLPGMFIRARLEQAVRKDVILVPQQAVTRGADGSSVFVVGNDDKVSTRNIIIDGAQNNRWIVREGLKAGDRVVVEGLQKIKPGAAVKAVAWKQPQAPAGASTVAASPPTSAGTAPAAPAGTPGSTAAAGSNGAGKSSAPTQTR